MGFETTVMSCDYLGSFVGCRKLENNNPADRRTRRCVAYLWPMQIKNATCIYTRRPSCGIHIVRISASLRLIPLNMYPTAVQESRFSFQEQQAATAPPPPMVEAVPRLAVPYASPIYASRTLQRGHSLQPGEWTSGLCHCFDDPENCMITCCCPCLTFGQITELINKGKKSCMSRGFLFTVLCFTGCVCFYSCFYRSKLRAQFDLRDEPCNDCVVHFCCTPCALCQEYRELKNHGFDMAIGWEANIDRQKRGVTTSVAPMVVTGMTR